MENKDYNISRSITTLISDNGDGVTETEFENITLGEDVESNLFCSGNIGELTAWERLAGLEVYGIISLAVASLLSFLTTIIFLESAWFLYQHVTLRERRRHLIRLLGLYPVFSLTSLMALYIPKSHTLTNLTASMYLSVCLHSFLSLILDYFGGRMGLLHKLKHFEVPLAGPPVCCCLICLPKIKIDSKNFSRIRAAVVQVAVVRPLTLYIAAVLWTDGIYDPDHLVLNGAYLWLMIASVVSTLVAMYALVMVFRASREPLKRYQVLSKFIPMQTSLIISNIQPMVLSIFISIGIIKPLCYVSPSIRANLLYDYIIIVEMFFMCLVATVYHRRKAENIENLYDYETALFAAAKELKSVENIDLASSRGSIITTTQGNGRVSYLHIPSEESLEEAISSHFASYCKNCNSLINETDDKTNESLV